MKRTVFSVFVALAFVSPVFSQPTRVNVTQKGSLLVWPEVVIRWNFQAQLITDTFISIANDLASNGVRLKFYFVSGDEPRAAVFIGDPPIILVERAHPGWNYFDNVVDLTHDEPTYFRATTGQPLGVTNFIALDPGSGDPMDPVFGNRPGRPDTDPTNPGGRVLRGFILAFAVDASGALLRHNHLAGTATIVDYQAPAAYEHAAWSFKANFPTILATDSLLLDGSPTGYDACPQFLLFDFFAAGASPLGPNALGVPSFSTHQLTLMPMIMDYSPTRPPEAVPNDTQFDVWNEDEVKLTNLHRCIRCWDSTFITAYGAPNFFTLAGLGSVKGRARIAGAANPACDLPGNPNASPPVLPVPSMTAPVIGVHQMITQWGPKVTRSGTTLSGLGERTDGRIKFVPQSDPPEGNGP